MASNHLFGTFTKFQNIHKATVPGSLYPDGSLMSTRHISAIQRGSENLTSMVTAQNSPHATARPHFVQDKSDKPTISASGTATERFEMGQSDRDGNMKQQMPGLKFRTGEVSPAADIEKLQSSTINMPSDRTGDQKLHQIDE